VRALHDVVAGAREFDRRIFPVGFLLDLVAFLARDGELAVVFDFVDGSAWAAAGPLPGYCGALVGWDAPW